MNIPIHRPGVSRTPDTRTEGDPTDAAKGPAVKSSKRGESRHNQWWYPKRCELPGCEARGEGLQKCAACCMVVYCCKEHQRQDWPAHKSECAVFRRIGARATFYTDEEMLTRFPLEPKGVGADVDCRRRVSPGSVCQLCLKTSGEVAMNRTTCCGEVVCGNSHEYELMSYSRDYCQRSHDRYTLCGYHGVEDRCTRGVDWRECPACTRGEGRDVGGRSGSRGEVADRLWRGLNPYNYCPLLEKDVPQHALCDTCSACGGKFITGMEGAVYGPRGLRCLKCSPTPGM